MEGGGHNTGSLPSLLSPAPTSPPPLPLQGAALGQPRASHLARCSFKATPALLSQDVPIQKDPTRTSLPKPRRTQLLRAAGAWE